MPTMHGPSALPAPVPELDLLLLRRTLKAQWNVSAHEILLLEEHAGHYTYQVKGEEDLILNVFPPGTDPDRLWSSAALMDYLHAALFPAPRVRTSREGHFLCSVRSRKLILRTCIPGHIPASSAAAMAELGLLAAKLHLLPPPGIKSPLHPADMKTAVLVRAKEKTAPTGYQDLVKALPAFVKLPEALVHTGLEVCNLVLSPGGNSALINWNNAGRGLALFDVVSPLAALLHEDGSFEETLYQAFYQAYTSVRPLSRSELRLFGDAVTLWLLYGCATRDEELNKSNWKKACHWQQQSEKLLSFLRH